MSCLPCQRSCLFKASKAKDSTLEDQVDARVILPGDMVKLSAEGLWGRLGEVVSSARGLGMRRRWLKIGVFPSFLAWNRRFSCVFPVLGPRSQGPSRFACILQLCGMEPSSLLASRFSCG